MPTDRFLIAPYDKDSGLHTEVKPWLIPDKAFSTLQNAYVFRGRVRKRFGSRWMGDTQQQSRLRINLGDWAILLGSTDGAGNAAGTVPVTLYQLGQRFVIGAETDTVTNPAPGPQPMTSTGPSVTHTFDITNGNFVFVGAPANTRIYFYPNTATTAAVTGNFTAIVPGESGAIGQMFSIGNTLFTVYQAMGATLSTGLATATFDTTTGVLVVTGNGENPSIAVYWYPALPVMGLLSLENQAINNEPVIGFDTTYAYQYLATGWERLNNEITAGASVWTGNNAQFFWASTYRGINAQDYVFFVTNNNAAEPNYMRTLLASTLQWDNFRPKVHDTTTGGVQTEIWVDTCLIIVPFKNRLVLFNTTETTTVTPGTTTQANFPFRARWSQLGSPLDPDAFKDDIPGKGFGADAPTSEAIVTVEFIKDRLIVFFERSTWEFVYTGNQVNPFVWQQINTELGAESTFSIVPFDKVAIGVGNVGVMACNGANVERIDTAIPQEVFRIHNLDSGVERVYGIRDYYVEMVYWTFPDPNASTDFPYPNQVLVFNYSTGTWAINDDSITAFGYFQPQTGITWDSTQITWDMTIGWDSGSATALFRQVIGGNQEGWTFIIDADQPTNAAVIQITDVIFSNDGSNIVTIKAIDHNFKIGDFIFIADVVGTLDMLRLNNMIFKIVRIIDKDNFTFIMPLPIIDPASVYNGGGVIRRVSLIDIQTKEYNFYADQDRNCYVSKVDFQVDRTDTGQVTVDYFISSNPQSMVAASAPVTGSNSNIGNNVLETSPYALYPFEQGQDRLLHPIYFQADGEFVQLRIYMSDAQMLLVIPVLNEDEVVVSYTGPTFEDFQLHSMCIYVTPSASRMQ